MRPQTPESGVKRWSTRSSCTWEVHEVGERITYGELQPRIPIETSDASSDCTAESAKVRALNIVIGKDYERNAMESVAQLLAQAGYRLAGLLNQIWP